MRSKAEEMAVWKARVAGILAKEARCPACAKAIKENEGTTKVGICQEHLRIRMQTVFWSRYE